MKKLLVSTALAVAMTLSAGMANAKELSFATFVPAASPTITKIYQPWIEWFNERHAGDDVSIKMFAGGTMGRNPRTQADLVSNGVADMTLTVPSYTPGVFPDYDVFELPGFATTTEEGSNAVKELYEAGKLRGYEDFHVVAIYTSDSYMIHSKPPIATFEDIKDKKIRVAGQIQTEVVEALGGVPQSMSPLEMAENIDRGLIAGAIADASVAKTFRVADVAKNHYDANLGVLVFTIIMNKDVYNDLPDNVKQTLAESRNFVIDKQVEVYSKAVNDNVAAWKADGEHTVVEPDEENRKKIADAVAPVLEKVAANATDGLLDAYRAKLEEIRNR